MRAYEKLLVGPFDTEGLGINDTLVRSATGHKSMQSKRRLVYGNSLSAASAKYLELKYIDINWRRKIILIHSQL